MGNSYSSWLFASPGKDSGFMSGQSFANFTRLPMRVSHWLLDEFAKQELRKLVPLSHV